MKKILLIITIILSSVSVYAEESNPEVKTDKEEVVNIEDAGSFETEAKIYPTPKKVEIKVLQKEFTETEIEILQSLESKRIELERKSQLLMIREKLLDISEAKLVERIETLKKLKNDLKILLGEVNKKEEKRLTDLAVVYSSMKPSLAAERLNILEDSTVYGILKRMNYKKSAKILEKMNLKKVKIVSKMLAEKTLLPEIKK